MKPQLSSWKQNHTVPLRLLLLILNPASPKSWVLYSWLWPQPWYPLSSVHSYMLRCICGYFAQGKKAALDTICTQGSGVIPVASRYN